MSTAEEVQKQLEQARTKYGEISAGFIKAMEEAAAKHFPGAKLETIDETHPGAIKVIEPDLQIWVDEKVKEFRDSGDIMGLKLLQRFIQKVTE